MMSMEDMFYSKVEPVWIIKPPSDNEKKKQQANKENAENSILPAIPGYPSYFYPPYYPPQPTPGQDDGKKKETKVALRVSICCNDCVERISVALKKLTGVKDVDCNIIKRKVIVTCSTAAPADIILESRRAFRDARQWTDDDE